MNRIRYGVYEETTNLAGRSVKAVRKRYEKTWGIPSNYSAFLSSQQIVNDAYVLQPNDNIGFHRAQQSVHKAALIPTTWFLEDVQA